MKDGIVQIWFLSHPPTPTPLSLHIGMEPLRSDMLIYSQVVQGKASPLKNKQISPNRSSHSHHYHTDLIL